MGGTISPPPKPKKRVTKVQARNRRVIAILLLAIVIFLFRKGCVACIHARKNTADAPIADQTITETSTTTAVSTTSEATIQQSTSAATTQPSTEYLISGSLPSQYAIEIDPIYQLPELPTGCEVTVLTMLLQFLGFDIDKLQIVENYLTCKVEGTATFREAFIGTPYDKSGYGCFAPVMIDAAQKYLTAQNSGRIIKDMTGSDFNDLLREVASNHPVAVWASIDMVDIEEIYCYTVYNEDSDNTDVYWLRNEHCYLLKGYDLDRNVVIVNDPLEGEMEYNLDRFKEVYAQCYRQAFIIY